MIILIPLGGLGKRFRDNGYKSPKALINIFGVPIINHLITNLNTKNIDMIYISHSKEYTNFRLSDRLIKHYKKLKNLAEQKKDNIINIKDKKKFKKKPFKKKIFYKKAK